MIHTYCMRILFHPNSEILGIKSLLKTNKILDQNSNVIT